MAKMPASGTWEQRAGWVVNQLIADLKLKDFQAAGPVGGFGVESGEFKHLHEIGQPEGQGGYGWAQWTGSRRVAFLNWCDAQGLDWRSDEANYGYFVYDLKHGYKGFLAKLKKTKTLEEATHLAHREYETPQEVLDGTETSYPKRLQYAQRALAGAGGGPEPVPPPAPPVESKAALDDALLALAPLVRIIQRELGITADGDYGSATRRAVLAYLKER
jgi:hypothetical protein